MPYRTDLAAQLEEASSDQMRVIVQLHPADLSQPGTAESFCDFGRTAEVRFERQGLPELAGVRKMFAGVQGNIRKVFSEDHASVTTALAPNTKS